MFFDEYKPESFRVTKWHWHPNVDAVRVWDDDFNVWVRNMIDTFPGWLGRMYAQYVGPEGGEFAHFIGRTQTLDADLKRVLVYLGHGEQYLRYQRQIIDWPKTRRSSGPRPGYNEDVKAALIASERECIRRFYSPLTINKRFYAKRQLLQ